MNKKFGMEVFCREVKSGILIACLLSIILVFTGCSDTAKVSDDDKQNPKVAEQSVDSADAKKESDESVEKSDDSSSSKESTSKQKTSNKKSSEKDAGSKSAKGKKWVPAVYKTVEHPAEYETVTVYVCPCGEEFDTYEAWAAHKQYWVDCNGGT